MADSVIRDSLNNNNAQITWVTFANVIIHEGHERKELNLCLAAIIDHRLRIEITLHLKILP